MIDPALALIACTLALGVGFALGEHVRVHRGDTRSRDALDALTRTHRHVSCARRVGLPAGHPDRPVVDVDDVTAALSEPAAWEDMS